MRGGVGVPRGVGGTFNSLVHSLSEEEIFQWKRGSHYRVLRNRVSEMRVQTSAESQKSSLSEMLLLLVLAVLYPGGDNQGASQGPTSFHLIQISSFVNSTWIQYHGSGWLDGLQIHGWNSVTDTAIFLKPWSKGNFSDVEISDLVELFRVYTFAFIREMRAHVHEFQLEYPFEIQGIAGCELHSGGAILSFLRGALGGLDFVSFRNSSCVPAPEGGSRAQLVCALLRPYGDIFHIVKKLLYETCPRFLLGVLEAGKADLQRQVKPEAWLSSGPSPGPGRLLLVCHVSGFYPKPVWVMWMRGDQEQQGTQRGDIMPNGDGTWHLQATLDVAAGEVAGLACRVKHSSLGGQDLVLHWGGGSVSIAVIILMVMVLCLVVSLGLALWFWRHRPC
ncbi:T-cell surface glycoprotein CD1b-like isoform X3 [Marmota monax]|uniref:T-cell surface glycoprotein CD1b-like isoform X3 n=1 Tax=Marmota monax TaxID=9995 RepID=UPI0026F2F9F3|nr:T-cell surface glycoprotein CD1b-like isoform X3 [Marmota monax]